MSAIPEALELHLGVPQVVLMGWAAMALLAALSWAGTRRLAQVPSGAQNLLETGLSLICGMADEMVGPVAPRFYPLFLGLFFFILFGNLLGLVPGFSSPTASLNTTVALALVVFFSTHVIGIREKGVLGYLAHFIPDLTLPWYLKPIEWFVKILMPVIEVIGELARPLSLSFRLFGNLVAKEVVLGIAASLAILFAGSTLMGALKVFLGTFSIGLRLFIILLGTLVSLIQAFVFMMLAMIYIGGAVRSHGGHQHA